MYQSSNQNTHMMEKPKTSSTRSNSHNPKTHTFYSHNDRDSRHIDYFLSTHPEVLQVFEPRQLASNTSSHLPVTAKLHVSFKLQTENTEDTVNPEDGIPKRRVKWSEADIPLYKDEVCKTISAQTFTDPESAHEHITTILLEAPTKAAPAKKEIQKEIKDSYIQRHQEAPPC